MLHLFEEGKEQHLHKLHGIPFTDLQTLIYEPLICLYRLKNIKFACGFGVQCFVIYFIAQIVSVSAVEVGT